MGVMEQILEQLKLLNERIDSLSAAGGRGEPLLIDGKAALSPKEAAELTGIGRQNLIELCRAGKVPHFKNGSHYLLPVKPLLEWLESEAYANLRSEESNFIRLIS